MPSCFRIHCERARWRRKDALLGDGQQRLAHLCVDTQHPRPPRRPPRASGVRNSKDFALRGGHAADDLVSAAELERGAVVVQLEQVHLHGGRVGAAEHREQLVVGDEEEVNAFRFGSRYCSAISAPPRFSASCRFASRFFAEQHSRMLTFLAVSSHDLRPALVGFVEALRLLGELVADVAAFPDEDALEVHPLALHRHPHLKHLADQAELALPLLHLAVKGFSPSGSPSSTAASGSGTKIIVVPPGSAG